MKKSLLMLVWIIVAFIVTGFANLAQAQEPVIYLDPSNVTVNVGDTFTVAVTFFGSAYYVNEWYFKIYWDPNLLECTGISEGSILAPGAPTSYFDNIDNILGYLYAGDQCYGEPYVDVEDGGILGYVTFHCKGAGPCALVFDYWPVTSLSDIFGNYIPSTTMDGFVQQVALPSVQYYLTVKTDPLGVVTIPGEGWYNQGTGETLNAPQLMTTPFLYWDVDGVSQGNLVNPITVTMDANHTATAHYYVPSVGGEWVPMNTVQMLVQIIGSAAVISAVAASFVSLKRIRKEKN